MENKECKKLETTTNEWITVAKSKLEDRVLATKKLLLKFCEKCEEADTCEDAGKIYRAITQ